MDQHSFQGDLSSFQMPDSLDWSIQLETVDSKIDWLTTLTKLLQTTADDWNNALSTLISEVQSNFDIPIPEMLFSPSSP
jgi:hypothetical protein